MEMRLELKNTERNDYYYEEAIKTLRTNIQFCGSSLKPFSLQVPYREKEKALLQ